jgi:hypothetical protein
MLMKDSLPMTLEKIKPIKQISMAKIKSLEMQFGNFRTQPPTFRIDAAGCLGVCCQACRARATIFSTNS